MKSLSHDVPLLKNPGIQPSDDDIELSCAANKFSISISDDSKFPNPNSSGNNKVKIGKCEFDLTTTPETVEERISLID